MAANFSNARNSALPCELMRGCSFAEDFVTLARIAENYGTDSGSGNTANNGLVTNGSGYLEYDVVSQAGDFTAVIRFSTTTTPVGNDYLISNYASGEGFYIHLSSAGITASHDDGIAAPTACVLPLSTLDYTDGEIHTITYIVNKTTGFHILYVDSETAKSQTTTAAGTTGASGNLFVASDGTNHFTGTIYKARIFDSVLTESEHDLYHTGSITSFMDEPLASYRCDSICDDTDGHKIWDRTLNLNDLYKADRVTSAAFPVLHTDKYLLDLVDDYITNWPTLPAAYTVVAALSTPQLGFPYIRQENDNTLIKELTTPGGFWGYLHSLVIHTGVLNQLQLYHTEYMHLYMLARGRARGLYHRLITEGVCKFVEFLDAGNYVFYDYASENPGIAHSVTRDDQNGCSFPSVDSHVEFDHDAAYNSNELTLGAYGDFATSQAACTLIDKGNDYKLMTNGNQIDLNGSTIAHTFANNEHIAATLKPGKKPRFFVDGVYIGLGSSTVTPSNNSTNLTIGNSNEHNHKSRYTLKQICMYDKALSDREISSLYDQARYIGGLDMETGQRVAVPVETFAGVVDYDKDPGGNFQLIDVVVTFDVAPTTSELIEIFSIRETVKIIEDSYDPSLSSATQHVFRFDKRFDNGITYGVDYANTDTNSVKVYSTYQLDPSVT